tara:strand:+ start:1514 stop:2014 length:501 start_codon:yes stop_codon:yes gene_type:complete
MRPLAVKSDRNSFLAILWPSVDSEDQAFEVLGLAARIAFLLFLLHLIYALPLNPPEGVVLKTYETIALSQLPPEFNLTLGVVYLVISLCLSFKKLLSVSWVFLLFSFPEALVFILWDGGYGGGGVAFAFVFVITYPIAACRAWWFLFRLRRKQARAARHPDPAVFD